MRGWWLLALKGYHNQETWIDFKVVNGTKNDVAAFDIAFNSCTA